MHLSTSTLPPAMGPVSSLFAAAPSATEVPFDPRPLTRSERRRGDLYIFLSPKLGRPVELRRPVYYKAHFKVPNCPAYTCCLDLCASTHMVMSWRIVPTRESGRAL